MNFSLQATSSISLKFHQYLKAFAKHCYYMMTLKWGGREGERGAQKEKHTLDLTSLGILLLD